MNGGLGEKGNRDTESGAIAEGRVAAVRLLNATVMFLDDAFGDREAKARAALVFGGEEGIEDPGQDRGHNPLP